MKQLIRESLTNKIMILDERGDGNAHHVYEVRSFDKQKVLANINFQKGPLKENKLNGCFQEDLIEICIDRLRCFQEGDFACRENALALTKLEEALMWLNNRTKDRVIRGVEGKTEK